MTPLPETVPEANETCMTMKTVVVDVTDTLTVGMAGMKICAAPPWY